MRERMRQRRAELGLTQEEAAKRAGIARTSWANIETSARNPRLTVAIGIKRALEYDGDNIFFDQGCLDSEQSECRPVSENY